MNRHRREYQRRVNRVVDFIEKNPAAQLSLDRLAQLAAFSPYHFHRVFKSVTHETLYEFSQRLRIEKGAQALLASRRGVTDTALQCGFASAATFARAFKAHFAMSATEWRAGGYRRWRKRNKDSKASKAAIGGKLDTGGGMKVAASEVRIKALPSFRVAYLRSVGPYGPSGIPRVWAKLGKWAAANEVDVANSHCVGIVYDNPGIAAAHTCRYDAGVVVSADFTADRHVNVTDTASGKYAVSKFNGTAQDIEAAWERTFSAWLPDSGFEPDDKPCFELYRGALADPKRGLSCELCLPVRAV